MIFNIIGIIYSAIEMVNIIIVIASFRTAKLDVLRYLLPQERSTIQTITLYSLACTVRESVAETFESPTPEPFPPAHRLSPIRAQAEFLSFTPSPDLHEL